MFFTHVSRFAQLGETDQVEGASSFGRYWGSMEILASLLMIQTLLLDFVGQVLQICSSLKVPDFLGPRLWKLMDVETRRKT